MIKAATLALAMLGTLFPPFVGAALAHSPVPTAPSVHTPAPVAPLSLTTADSNVMFEEGNGFYGYTTVRVWGDGRVKVTFDSEGKRATYVGKLTPRELAAFKRTLATNRPRLTTNANRPGRPEESTTTFQDDRHARPIVVWADDVPSDPALKALKSAFLAIAKAISHGKVTY